MRKQYNQYLNTEQASEGIIAAIENAKSLLEDAIILFNNNKIERAVALAILAIEEVGKLPIIRTIILEEDPKILKKEWQNYRKHTAKNLSWILPDLVRTGAIHFDEFYPIFDENMNHGQVLEDLKQLAFYTDIFSDCKWSIPKNIITREIAEMILNSAKNQVLKGHTDMTSKEELEIYIKHVKPVWKSDLIKMKEALINCYKEAEDKKLIKQGTAKRMSEFLH